MRTPIVLLSFFTLFATAVAWGDLNLDDFDDDLMDNMDDAYKDLEVVIPAHNAASAKIDAGTLHDGLAKTEQYFVKKNVTDAVGWARDAQASTQKILEALERGDFDSALTATHETKKICRSCHDAYKHKDKDKGP
jgi:hypothetical protein